MCYNQEIKVYALDDRYSTTKFLTHPFDNYLIYDDKGIVTDESKFNINDLKFNIKNSKFIGKPEDKFETMLFLPKTNNRLYEGGLRTKGYFKHNYKLCNNEWYIIDNDNKLIEKIPLPNSVLKTNINNKQITDIPLVSIITVVYNGEKYLEETIQSVITQTYPNVEYIIIDGGSTDGTLDIIKKHENVIDYFISEPDKGIYDAMNKGIILSTGSVIGFVNADDYYGRDNILEDVVNKFISNKIDILYGNICYIHPQTKKMLKKLNSRLYKLNYRMSVYHPSVFMKKEIYKMKLYSLKYKIASDYELLLSCKITKLRFKYLDRIIVYMREGGASYKNKAIGQNEQNIIIKETYSNKIFLRKFYLSLRKFSILYNKYLKKFFLLSNVNSIIL